MGQISVIFPTYNSERTVVRSLMSAINQTRRPDEIVISDNLSTDSTLNLIRQVIALNPDVSIVLTSCTIPGAGPNRNNAVSQSSFPILAFLDSDDLWDANFLEHMTRNRIEDDSIRGSYARYVSYSGRVFGSSIRSTNDLSAKNAMVERGVMPFLLSTWVMNRLTFDKLEGFDQEYRTAQDFEFMHRHLLGGGDIQIVREQLITYLIHSSSKSTTLHFEQRLSAKYVLEREKSEFKSLPEFLDANVLRKRQIYQSRSDILIRRFVTSERSSIFQKIHFLFFAFLYSPIRFLKKIWLQRPSNIFSEFIVKRVKNE